MERKKVELKDGWRFALCDTVPDEQAYGPVTLPHDWIVTRTVTPDAPLTESQGFFVRGDVGWYALDLELPELEGAQEAVLHFGGVWENSTVFVNDVPVGGHRYGYTPFTVDITGSVHAGKNRILVRVDSTGAPADRWYSGAGIYRPVSLILRDRVHLETEAIQVVQSFAADGATLTILTGTDLPVRAVLWDAEKQAVSEGEGSGQITLNVSDPKRWCAKTPYLYDLTLALDTGDAVSLHLGIREVRIGTDGLYVNGQEEKLRGVCLHQDMGCRGIAATPGMWRDRLVHLKNMGVNALRLAHHMHSSEMLDLCDELGFYVYSECFDKWHSGLYGRYFAADWDTDLSAMILRDRNRPSVLIWGVGNEVENQGQASMLETLRMLVARAHALDSTRPVTVAMNPHFKRPGKKIDFSKVMDIQKIVDEVDEQEIEDVQERIDRIAGIAGEVDLLACNYQEQWFDEIHARLPEKVILSTEAYPFFMGHRDAMQNYVERIPAFVPEREKWNIGSFIWTGYDYLGESMGYPSKGWTGSLLRTDGSERIAADILRARWTEAPFVSIGIMDTVLGDEFAKPHWAVPAYLPLWDFPMLHQGALPYLLATNCERAEVLVNGRVFYAPAPNADGYITGFVPWLPGEIEVRGYIGDHLAARQVIRTPGKAARLKLRPFSDRSVEVGEELMLTAFLTDKEGNSTLRETPEINFSVQGPGVVCGVDNGNLMDPTPFGQSAIPAWLGSASCVVRRTGKGKILVSACAQGMENSEYILPDE
ncbi:MAG: glycoside hydrolase family 2 protein [Clostridia bacterium]|nr:glycoside hydrolase family 2 protein [Clostridia bacterium]